VGAELLVAYIFHFFKIRVIAELDSVKFCIGISTVASYVLDKIECHIWFVLQASIPVPNYAAW